MRPDPHENGLSGVLGSRRRQPVRRRRAGRPRSGDREERLLRHLRRSLPAPPAGGGRFLC
jgi:hypothetical protein